MAKGSLDYPLYCWECKRPLTSELSKDKSKLRVKWCYCQYLAMKAELAHTVLSHVHQFIQYVEDRMAAPKLFDKTVMLQKLEQVKEVLDSAETTTKSRSGTGLQVREESPRKDKGMAHQRLKGSKRNPRK